HLFWAHEHRPKSRPLLHSTPSWVWRATGPPRPDNHGDIAYRGVTLDGVAEYIGDHDDSGVCRLRGRALQFCRRGLVSRSITGTATRPMPSSNEWSDSWTKTSSSRCTSRSRRRGSG